MYLINFLFFRPPKFLMSTSIISSNRNETRDSDSDWLTEDGEEDSQEITSGSSCSNISTSSIKINHHPVKSKELVRGRSVPVEIICLDSKATIVWQDGTEEKDIPTTQLYYSISLDDHEFFPGEWVIKENKTDDKYGAVQNVNYLERTASVSLNLFSFLF